MMKEWQIHLFMCVSHWRLNVTQVVSHETQNLNGASP